MGSVTPAAGVAFGVGIWLRSDTPVTVTINANQGALTTVNVTPTWQYATAMIASASGASVAQVVVRSVAGTNTPFVLDLAAPQANYGTALGPYYPTTTTADTAYTVSHLTWDGRHNLALRSDAVCTSPWGANSGPETCTPDLRVAPDGQTTMDLVANSGTSNVGGYIQLITFPANTFKTTVLAYMAKNANGNAGLRAPCAGRHKLQTAKSASSVYISPMRMRGEDSELPAWRELER